MTDGFRGDCDIGHLCGHADDERKIDEIPVIRITFTGKLESVLLVTPLAVEFMRVVQCEDAVDEKPGRQDRYYSQQQLIELPSGALRAAEFEDDCADGGERRRSCQDEDSDLAFVLGRGVFCNVLRFGSCHQGTDWDAI